MFELFYKPYHITSGILEPKLIRTLTLLEIEIDKVKEYYSGSSISVKRPNVLVSLMSQITIDTTLPMYILEDELDNSTIYYSKNYGIVSNLSKGKILNSVIVPNAKEIFIVTDELHEDINKYNYREYETIRCNYHTKHNIAVHHPSKFNNINKHTDIFIYDIDLVGMCLQYVYWSKEELLKDRDTDMARFLYTVVFTNLITSITNISLWNRFLELNNGNTILEDMIKNPIHIIDYSSKIDKGYLTLIKKLSKITSIRYENGLKNVPVLEGNSALEALAMKSRLINKNNKWVVWVSRSRYVHNIVKLFGTNSFKINRDLLTYIAIKIKKDDRDNTLDYILSLDGIDFIFEDDLKIIYEIKERL